MMRPPLDAALADAQSRLGRAAKISGSVLRNGSRVRYRVITIDGPAGIDCLIYPNAATFRAGSRACSRLERFVDDYLSRMLFVNFRDAS